MEMVLHLMERRNINQVVKLVRTQPKHRDTKILSRIISANGNVTDVNLRESQDSSTAITLIPVLRQRLYLNLEAMGLDW
jgi:hypothetical protein